MTEAASLAPPRGYTTRGATWDDLASVVDLFTQHKALAQALLNPVVPVQRKRAAKVSVRHASVANRHGATPGVHQRHFRRSVERISDRELELTQRFPLALMLAQIPSPIMMSLRIVGGKLQRVLEALLGVAVFAQHRVHQPVDVVGLRVVGVKTDRDLQFVDSDVHLSPFVIARRQLGVQPRPVMRARLLWLRRSASRLHRRLRLLRRRRLVGATGDHKEREYGDERAKEHVSAPARGRF